MTIYASKSLGGFIDTDVGIPGGQLPADAIEITGAQRDALIAGQAQGQLIQFNTGSAPGLVARTVNLKAYANQKQWALATGGFTVTIGGQALTFATDEVSQALINGKWSRLQAANPPATIKWQFASGFVVLAAADFVASAIKIADFVQATFDALDTIEADIDASTIATTAQVDAAIAAVANSG